jgi:inosose dehydratase
MIDRRSVMTGIAAAAIAMTAPGSAKAAAPRRYRRIGHTGITWGYSADDAPNAIRDVGELGFRGFESFGSVLEAWDERGGLGDLLEAQHLPLVGAYCPLNLTDPAQRSDEVRKAARWATLISSYGGRIAVIGPNAVDRKRFDFAAVRNDLIITLNDIAHVMSDFSLKAAVHPHSGSCIMQREEIQIVMDTAHARDVWLCPDTGEMLASGVDPLPIIRQYGERIAHVHIKDYKGGSSHDGFVPVGKGKVKVAAVMDALEALPGEFMVMGELNPDPAQNKADPLAPRHLVEQSKAAFEKLGYRFLEG